MNISSNIKIQLIKTSSTFKLAQQNLSNQTNITTIIHRKPFESYICNNRNINRFPSSSTTPSNDSFDIYRKISLEKYCNIVPIPQHKWFNAQTYTENEIAFVIFTSSKFYHTRATATRDTWLSRITNYYFLSATPYPYLPVTVISDAGENKLSNVKKLFYGLQIIYQQQMNLSVNQRQKWFYIAGCDTFIIPYHLLKRLDGLDYRKPILLGGHTGRHTCPRKNGGTFIIEFPSGGAGFFFSIKLLEIMQPHLTNYVENIWPRKSDASDVALTCLAIQLGVKLIKKAGFWAHPPAFTLAEEKRSKFHNEPEPNNFHYIKPDEMYALDEFYIHQHIDRLIHDENWDELIKFARRFVTSHYELLRKKRRECPLPNRGNKTK
ncbi:unnamed protein product [Rotaria sordida]|uniref:Fringe-like glycosyltransferase domain-containing protein n=1 Tax=Rotaria sordida TaxID=392033 RepID=A0A815LP98_9BILA|nr:unnamed protein product [Rotaria sordida]